MSTDDAWSGLVTRVHRTERDLPARRGQVKAVVVHTTGSGIVLKALKRDEDPLAYAAAYYRGRRAYASHYLVGHDFTRADAIVGTVPENLVAYHAGVGRKLAAMYRQGLGVWDTARKGPDGLSTGPEPLGRYSDWRERWPGLDGPHGLIKLRAGVNAQTVGVDFLAPEPGERHSDLQIRWVAALVRDVLERHGVPLAKGAVLRHADIDPINRTSKRGGWDPPRYAFEALCEHLGIESWPSP